MACCARAPSRRGPYRADDPDLPGLLAIDAGGDDFQSRWRFLSSLVVAVFSRRNAEHHDAGRPRAGRSAYWSTIRPWTIENTHRLWDRRNACRFPEATLHGAAENRGAYPGFDARHQLACSRRWYSSRGPAKYLFTPLGLAVVFCDAGFLRIVANPDADHDRLAA